MAETVRCSTCGFLAKHCPGVHIPTPKIFEMDDHARKTGRAFQHTTDALAGLKESYPVCFRNVQEVRAELEFFQEPKNQNPDACLTVINRERSCSQWCAYIPGFNPKEHFVYLKFAELEIKRQEFEQRMEADRRTFELGLAKMNRKLTVIFGVLAFALAFIQLGYPNGLPWLVKWLGNLFPAPLPPYPPM